MLAFTMKKADSEEYLKFTVLDETCEIDNNNVIKSFSAYVGISFDGEHHFLPYILTDDRSDQNRKRLYNICNGVFNSLTLGGRTAKGFFEGAEKMEAINLGAEGMKLSALKGASKGFAIGIAIIAGKNIAVHAFHKFKQKSYYISPYGPDLEGPVKFPE